MLLSGRPFTMVTIALPGLCFTLGHRLEPARRRLDRELAPRRARHAPAEATRAAWQQLARPIIVSNVTTALGFGLLAVIPVTPVQEMALFGAAGELLSGLHVLFVLPKCLLWFGADGELARNRDALRRRTLDRRRARPRSPARLTRLQRVRYRAAGADGRGVCWSLAWLISTVSYDSTYLT